jgi:uncharacterized phiE125 gp8 family phage protein
MRGCDLGPRRHEADGQPAGVIPSLSHTSAPPSGGAFCKRLFRRLHKASTNMTTRPLTPPEFEPITLEQARMASRVDDDDTSEDGLIDDVLIPGVREEAEQILRRSIMRQQWRKVLDDLSCGEILLPWPKLLSVSAVEYRDRDGNWQTLDESAYEVDLESTPGRVLRALNATWPPVYPFPNSVRVDFWAGYADGDEDEQRAAVPASLKRWMLARVATAYEHRLEILAGASVASLPNRFVDAALDRERFYGTCD